MFAFCIGLWVGVLLFAGLDMGAIFLGLMPYHYFMYLIYIALSFLVASINVFCDQRTLIWKCCYCSQWLYYLWASGVLELTATKILEDNRALGLLEWHHTQLFEYSAQHAWYTNKLFLEVDNLLLACSIQRNRISHEKLWSAEEKWSVDKLWMMF